MLRLLLTFLGLALLAIVPFLIWGGDMEVALAPVAAADRLRDFGAWAWAVGLALLIADPFLPVPATAVMTALGLIYGPVLGGLVGAAGAMLAGMTATYCAGPWATPWPDEFWARRAWPRASGCSAAARPAPGSWCCRAGRRCSRRWCPAWPG
jgi:uncharacterized membrane protein YdjX (TVP38/TMEM64 family)